MTDILQPKASRHDGHNEKSHRKSNPEGSVPLLQRQKIREDSVALVIEAVKIENFRVVRDEDPTHVPPQLSAYDTARLIAQPVLEPMAATVYPAVPTAPATASELFDTYSKSSHIDDARKNVNDSAPVSSYPEGYRSPQSMQSVPVAETLQLTTDEAPAPADESFNELGYVDLGQQNSFVEPQISSTDDYRLAA